MAGASSDLTPPMVGWLVGWWVGVKPIHDIPISAFLDRDILSIPPRCYLCPRTVSDHRDAVSYGRRQGCLVPDIFQSTTRLFVGIGIRPLQEQLHATFANARFYTNDATLALHRDHVTAGVHRSGQHPVVAATHRAYLALPSIDPSHRSVLSGCRGGT